mmetsp:Transcript_20688/g.57425  ORF Transcript_20688/g.57425 Transcript_20688/m.57425 type:complete len:224 (-) Transcript_20688:253-924(-)
MSALEGSEITVNDEASINKNCSNCLCYYALRRIDRLASRLMRDTASRFLFLSSSASFFSLYRCLNFTCNMRTAATILVDIIAFLASTFASVMIVSAEFWRSSSEREIAESDFPAGVIGLLCFGLPWRLLERSRRWAVSAKSYVHSDSLSRTYSFSKSILGLLLLRYSALGLLTLTSTVKECVMSSLSLLWSSNIIADISDCLRDPAIPVNPSILLNMVWVIYD